MIGHLSAVSGRLSNCVEEFENKFDLKMLFNQHIQFEILNRYSDEHKCQQFINTIEKQLSSMNVWSRWNQNDVEIRRNIMTSLFSLLHYKALDTSSNDTFEEMFRSELFIGNIWDNDTTFVCADHFRKHLFIKMHFENTMNALLNNLSYTTCQAFASFFKKTILNFTHLNSYDWLELPANTKKTVIKSVFALMYFNTTAKSFFQSKEDIDLFLGDIFDDRNDFYDLQGNSNGTRISKHSNAKLAIILISLTIFTILIYILLRLMNILPGFM